MFQYFFLLLSFGSIQDKFLFFNLSTSFYFLFSFLFFLFFKLNYKFNHLLIKFGALNVATILFVIVHLVQIDLFIQIFFYAIVLFVEILIKQNIQTFSFEFGLIYASMFWIENNWIKISIALAIFFIFEILYFLGTEKQVDEEYESDLKVELRENVSILICILLNNTIYNFLICSLFYDQDFETKLILIFVSKLFGKFLISEKFILEKNFSKTMIVKILASFYLYFQIFENMYWISIFLYFFFDSIFYSSCVFKLERQTRSIIVVSSIGKLVGHVTGAIYIYLSK